MEPRQGFADTTPEQEAALDAHFRDVADRLAVGALQLAVALEADADRYRMKGDFGTGKKV
jgi:hypothetical protein